MTFVGFFSCDLYKMFLDETPTKIPGKYGDQPTVIE